MFPADQVPALCHPFGARERWRAEWLAENWLYAATSRVTIYA
jgi:hypothetical protein